MSRNLSASQYDKAYAPHKLGNWEAPKAAKPPVPAAKTEDGRTIPIANEKGYIVSGAKKIPGSAFVPSPPQKAPARWPQPNPTISGTSAATMGYKGIQTDYLPTATVALKTVDIPGCKERKYQ